ncbi:MAG: PqqD family protein [Muribaculaceae bacterium]|nr:PqqD family protein [Muribaculaceae bacterium]
MKIKKGFTLRTVMNQKIVIAEGNNADSFGKIINLNSSAAMLWEELVGKTFEVEDAAELLVQKYGIDRAQALEDAKYIIDLMAEKGLLEQ